MPSAFTHAGVGLALGTAFRKPGQPVSFWIAGAVCAAAPDLDAVGLRVGIPYDSILGHRGFTHSLVFAALLAGSVVGAWFRGRAWQEQHIKVWGFLFVATASHGLLDMLTNGGRGVALLAPFTSQRFFFPCRPIEVSPLSLHRFFQERGLVVIASELRWVWLPAALFAVVMLLVHRRGSARKTRV